MFLELSATWCLIKPGQSEKTSNLHNHMTMRMVMPLSQVRSPARRSGVGVG